MKNEIDSLHKKGRLPDLPFFEELYKKKNFDYYVFDHLDWNLISPLIDLKEHLLIILDYESFQELIWP